MNKYIVRSYTRAHSHAHNPFHTHLADESLLVLLEEQSAHLQPELTALAAGVHDGIRHAAQLDTFGDGLLEVADDEGLPDGPVVLRLLVEIPVVFVLHGRGCVCGAIAHGVQDRLRGIAISRESFDEALVEEVHI